jgi:class 3 adenylate cyclase
MELLRVRGRLTGPTGRSEDAELLVDAGASELMEFTVIGGNVNLGARVERLTRDHRVEILVTEAVRQTLDPRFVLRELPPVALRGVSGPLVTFAVEGFRP